ncbi:MAG: hypothetical protein JXA00_05585 [Candidatus Thermoplasmatota archaeon]|nr:hypothetical protein [Candidatus Thermoplasmatota archaeon]
MGTTIALKLSAKEERIVAELNRQGMSKSELLRSALREYFKMLHDSSKEWTSEYIPEPQKSDDLIQLQESLLTLRQELNAVRHQVETTHLHLTEDVQRLQQQISELSQMAPHEPQTGAVQKARVLCDIHDEVDTFLKVRHQRQTL